MNEAKSIFQKEERSVEQKQEPVEKVEKPSIGQSLGLKRSGPSSSNAEIEKEIGNASIAMGDAKQVDKEIEEAERTSPEDVKLAEELLFNGYVEYERRLEKIPNIKITVCSTNASDGIIIDEIIYEYIKSHEDKDGEADISQKYIDTFRNLLHISLSYLGVNGKDISKAPKMQLKSIKAAIKRLEEYNSIGDLENANKLSKALKMVIQQRSGLIRGISTPMIDFINDTKVKFDNKMFEIMQGDIIPKY